MLRLGDGGGIDVGRGGGLGLVGGIGGGGMGMGRNRRVVVGEDRVCGGCFKRLGGSVIVVLPDNSVVHYGCLSKVGGAGAGRKESLSLGGGGGGMEALRRGRV